MPRQARLDVQGGLYHVIARGVDRREVFHSEQDCEDFEQRLADLVEPEEMTLFAYVLMVNHFHLVIRRDGPRRLGRFMGRLLTGYVGSYNLRHRRVGHLFQNRYKAILCDEDAYLLQLVRYVHLNPLRAKMVDDPASYRWSSHSDYLSRRPRPWIDTDEVLEQAGGRRAYARFIASAYGEGHRADLCGSIQEAKAGTEKSHKDMSSDLWLGGQILGKSAFAKRMVRHSESDVELRRELESIAGENMDALAERAATRNGITVEKLRGKSRPREVCAARRDLVKLALVDRGLRLVDVARYLQISTASVAVYRRKLIN